MFQEFLEAMLSSIKQQWVTERHLKVMFSCCYFQVAYLCISAFLLLFHIFSLTHEWQRLVCASSISRQDTLSYYYTNMACLSIPLTKLFERVLTNNKLITITILITYTLAILLLRPQTPTRHLRICSMLTKGYRVILRLFRDQQGMNAWDPHTNSNKCTSH